MLEADFIARRGSFSLAVRGHWDARTLGVFGKSGAGKTLLLRILAGLERPVSGMLRVDGQVLFDSEKNLWTPPQQRGFASVFQDDRLFPHLSIRQNLLFGERYRPPDQRRITLDEVVEALDLEPFLGRKPAQLSGGQRQRVSLGRALLCSPRVLLCDEPLSALDTGARMQVLRYLQRATRHFDLPLLYVSHDIVEVQTLCEKILLLKDGGVRVGGTFTELAHDAEVLKAELSGTVTNVWHGQMVHEKEDTAFVCGAGEAALRIQTGQLTSDEKDEPTVLTLPAGAVAVALHEPTELSMRNRFCGRLARMTETNAGVLLEVDCGQPIFAQITRRSAKDMELRLGQPLWCVFKVSSLGGL